MPRRQPIELFMPPNILKAKAGSSPRGLDLKAIARAESAVQELSGEFRDWAAQDLERLAAARDSHADNSSAETRAALLRAAHDLKGQAASYGFPLVGRVAWSLSRLLDEMPEVLDLPAGLVDAHVDAMQVIFRENVADGNDAIVRLLCTELDARVTDALKSKSANPTAG
jgi:chemotaxis protein histidine kinase CheA